MANQWDSEYAIWCDLSVAQGREVPAQINHAVAKDERPPRVVLVEETEEQFFGNYVDGGDYSCGPDLSLIKQMLQEAKASQPEEEQIVMKKIKKTGKNLAIESILQMQNHSEPYQNGHSAVNPSTSTSAGSLLFNAPNMFKKKRKKVATSTSPKNTPSTEVNQTVSEVEQPRMFVPSARAAEYVRRYHEQIQAQERVREDVWARVQREMKELDLKKKSQCAPSSADTPAHGIDAVRLPTPRHSFTDTEHCVVCKVLCAHAEPTK